MQCIVSGFAGRNNFEVNIVAESKGKKSSKQSIKAGKIAEGKKGILFQRGQRNATIPGTQTADKKSSFRDPTSKE